MDDMLVSWSADPSAPAIEPAILAKLFTMGDAQLRLALRAQLQIDFERLHEEIGASDEQAAARAVHEVKGLAGTVGAMRLAELATHLDTFGADLAPDARGILVATMRAELSAVLEVLAQVGDDAAT